MDNKLEYSRLYRLKNKEKISAYWKKYYYKHRDKELSEGKEYYKENRLHVLRKSRRNYLKNKELVCEGVILWRKNNPFMARISCLFTGIKERCRNKNNTSYKYYGKRGIKCYLTFKDLIFLWRRDNANKLRFPSIDRIDNDGSYIRTNCRFIERAENSRKSWRDRKKSLAL